MKVKRPLTLTGSASIPHRRTSSRQVRHRRLCALEHPYRLDLASHWLTYRFPVAAASSALSRFSNSPASIVRTNRSTKAETDSASPSNSSPAATASVIAAIATAASSADLRGGIRKLTGRSRRGGTIRSRQRRSAAISPPCARPNQRAVAPRRAPRNAPTGTSAGETIEAGGTARGAAGNATEGQLVFRQPKPRTRSRSGLLAADKGQQRDDNGARG